MIDDIVPVLRRLVQELPVLSGEALAVGAAAEEIERLRGRWIPVSERLPEDGAQCVVWHKRSGECRIAFRYKGEWYEGSIPITANVTHWMPLPEPPEAK